MNCLVTHIVNTTRNSSLITAVNESVLMSVWMAQETRGVTETDRELQYFNRTTSFGGQSSRGMAEEQLQGFSAQLGF